MLQVYSVEQRWFSSALQTACNFQMRVNKSEIDFFLMII